MAKALIQREEAFVAAVLAGCSHAEAARLAGYSERRAKQADHEMAHRPRVQRELLRQRLEAAVSPHWFEPNTAHHHSGTPALPPTGAFFVATVSSTPGQGTLGVHPRWTARHCAVTSWPTMILGVRLKY